MSKYKPPTHQVFKNSTKYRPPVSKYTSKRASRNSNAKWVGASILLYSITPDGYVYFLLGQESTYEGYKDSEKWSDFGGSAKIKEDEYTCAAREFIEETYRTINPFPKKYGHSLPDVFTVAQELKDKKYTARIDFNFLDTRRPKTYTTFLIRIPWDPTLRARFQKRIGTKRSTSLLSTFPSKNRYSNFQGKLNAKRCHLPEKQAIQFFSIPALLNSSKYKKETPQFRSFFKCRMLRILSLVFPNNVREYQILSDAKACKALYQGPAMFVPLTQHKPKQVWTRGSRVPTNVELGSQPPSRIFHNFNTHKRFTNSKYNTKEPVDKIYFYTD